MKSLPEHLGLPTKGLVRIDKNKLREKLKVPEGVETNTFLTEEYNNLLFGKRRLNDKIQEENNMMFDVKKIGNGIPECAQSIIQGNNGGIQTSFAAPGINIDNNNQSGTGSKLSNLANAIGDKTKHLYTEEQPKIQQLPPEAHILMQKTIEEVNKKVAEKMGTAGGTGITFDNGVTIGAGTVAGSIPGVNNTSNTQQNSININNITGQQGGGSNVGTTANQNVATGTGTGINIGTGTNIDLGIQTPNVGQTQTNVNQQQTQNINPSDVNTILQQVGTDQAGNIVIPKTVFDLLISLVNKVINQPIIINTGSQQQAPQQNITTTGLPGINTTATPNVQQQVQIPNTASNINIQGTVPGAQSDVLGINLTPQQNTTVTTGSPNIVIPGVTNNITGTATTGTISIPGVQQQNNIINSGVGSNASALGINLTPQQNTTGTVLNVNGMTATIAGTQSPQNNTINNLFGQKGFNTTTTTFGGYKPASPNVVIPGVQQQQNNLFGNTGINIQNTTGTGNSGVIIKLPGQQSTAQQVSGVIDTTLNNNILNTNQGGNNMMFTTGANNMFGIGGLTTGGLPQTTSNLIVGGSQVQLQQQNQLNALGIPGVGTIPGVQQQQNNLFGTTGFNLPQSTGINITTNTIGAGTTNPFGGIGSTLGVGGQQNVLGTVTIPGVQQQNNLFSNTGLGTSTLGSTLGFGTSGVNLQQQQPQIDQATLNAWVNHLASVPNYTNADELKIIAYLIQTGILNNTNYMSVINNNNKINILRQYQIIK